MVCFSTWAFGDRREVLSAARGLHTTPDFVCCCCFEVDRRESNADCRAYSKTVKMLLTMTAYYHPDVQWFPCTLPSRENAFLVSLPNKFLC